MAIAVAATKEAMASHYASLATHASMHTGNPGTTGINEATGGAPAYARKPITWNAGTVDGQVVSDPIDFDLPAGTYTHAGLWDAAVAGNFRDYCTASVTFAGQGIYRLTLTYVQG